MARPIDLSLPVRESVIVCLKAYAPLTAVLAVARIYDDPPANPTWPFIRYGFPIVTPYEASGLGGVQVRVTLHAFVHGPRTNSIYAVTGHIVDAMRDLTLDGLHLLQNEWLATNLVRDTEEKDGYHGICEFDLIAVRRD
jgi:hypothetical protein